MRAISDFQSGVLRQEKRTCSQHGEYMAVSAFAGRWTDCPECAKEKAAADELERQREVAQMQRENARRAVELRLGRSGVPLRFRNCRVNNFQVANAGQQTAKDFAEQYVRGFADVLKTGRSAVFLGRPGTGKNHLACAISMALIERGFSAVVITLMAMMRKIKSTYGGNGSEDDAIALFVEPDLLVIDEFGVGFDTDTERRLLFDVVNQRYELMKPTLLLTNLSRTAFEAAIEPRVYDRLRDNGGRLVSFDWESWRG